MCDIPDVLHVNRGSDFTSLHLEQASADLRIRLIYSAVARPEGRGKIERLFRTSNTELLPELPGNLRNGKLTSPPPVSCRVGRHERHIDRLDLQCPAASRDRL